MINDDVMLKLNRPGSAAYLSKSGGMSNELNSIICQNSDGVYKGIASYWGRLISGISFHWPFVAIQQQPVGSHVGSPWRGGWSQWIWKQSVKHSRVDISPSLWLLGALECVLPSFLLKFSLVMPVNWLEVIWKQLMPRIKLFRVC
jgi:hypothetical protein